MVAVVLLGGCGTEVASQGAPPPATPVPTGKASGGPIPTPPPKVCPASGAQVTVGPVEAALGHRAVVLKVTNCRARTLTLNGYPAVAVLDYGRKPLGITVAHDSSYMAIDPGPARLRLAKGQTALSVVAWSNTVADGPDPETGQFLKVAASKGDAQAVWPVVTDLGTTGKLEVTAWARKLKT
ncbi:hypothetical protein GCM10028799_22790 [Kribbella italica]|nr:DUF4232 domain-containing protein [Kribbella italica]